jgi:hypothetical protein
MTRPRGHISKVETQREWLKKPAPPSAENCPSENPAGVAQAAIRRQGARLMGEAKRRRGYRAKNPMEFSVRRDHQDADDRALENGRRLERTYLEIFQSHPEYSTAKMREMLEARIGAPIPDDTFDVIEGNRRRGTLGVAPGDKGNRGLTVRRGEQ